MSTITRTLYCNDNLYVMKGIEDESIDLIYLDPPFNKKQEFTAPIGSTAEGASFKDYWNMSDINVGWLISLQVTHPDLYNFLNTSTLIGDKSNKYYLTYIAIRLIEMKRILKKTGSIYLHCDTTMSHYLKLLMDVIFGHNNFRNEIVWERTKGPKGSQHKPKKYGTKKDSIFFYVKSNQAYFELHSIYRKLGEDELLRKYPYEDEHGRYKRGPIERDKSMGDRPNLCYKYKGYRNRFSSGWRVSKENLIKIDQEGNLGWSESGLPFRKIRMETEKGEPVFDLWTDINRVQSSSIEKVGYPTQKPIALLDRIINASCPIDGIVLDPFCGCATTLIASERLQRNWIGIDVSDKAFELLKTRLTQEVTGNDDDSLHKYVNEVSFTKEIPESVDKNYEDDFFMEDHSIKKMNYEQIKQFKHDTYQASECKCCVACKTQLPIQLLEVDHINPRSKGGEDIPDNLQLLCSYCNRVKGNRTMEYLLDRIKEEEERMKVY